MGPYGSLLFLSHSYLSSWVGPFASLCVLMGPNGSS